MVHAKQELGGDKDGDGGSGGIEDDIARDLNPTWWPFLLLSVGLCVLARTSSKLPRSLDNPRS